MALELALVDVDDPRLAAWERSREKSAQGHDAVSLALLRTFPRETPRHYPLSPTGRESLRRGGLAMTTAGRSPVRQQRR
jgi:hypothetical protein